VVVVVEVLRTTVEEPPLAMEERLLVKEVEIVEVEGGPSNNERCVSTSIGGTICKVPGATGSATSGVGGVASTAEWAIGATGWATSATRDTAGREVGVVSATRWDASGGVGTGGANGGATSIARGSVDAIGGTIRVNGWTAGIKGGGNNASAIRELTWVIPIIESGGFLNSMIHGVEVLE
jgi:hypothetical protein